MKKMVLFLVGLGTACSPTADDTMAEGGQGPNPTASLRGTITYTGLAPTCDAEGVVQGLVLLTLFSTANPPLPLGGGFPVSLLLVPGTDLFRPSDCRQPGDPRLMTRTTAFTWPSIPMDGPGGQAATYTIAAIWDDDRNLNPLYRVRSSPTAGDAVGGAFDNPLVAPTQTVVQVGPSSEMPDGQVLQGVSIALGLPVNTEVPLTRLSTSTRPLNSESVVPLALDQMSLDQGLLAQTDAALVLPDLTEPAYTVALDAAGLSLAIEPVARAWYIDPLDLDADGATDLHPILGTILGTPWLAPATVLVRARTLAEQQAGVPDVVFFPHAIADRAVKANRVGLGVPPIAVVQLDSRNPACGIPYAAPGNLALVYEGAAAVCTELPTGAYDVLVVHGRAGATPMMAPPETSETGVQLVGGQFAGQVWSIPNELGPPDTRYDPQAVNQLDPDGATTSITLADQGPEGRFFVIDADPAGGLPSARLECQQALDPTMGIRPIQFVDVPAECCAAVAHLCGLPLCPARALPDNLGDVRELDTLEPDGAPACVPFEMPPSCCTTAE